jgi:hypothetical protein
MNYFKIFALIVLASLTGCKKNQDNPAASADPAPVAAPEGVPVAAGQTEPSQQPLPPPPSYVAAQARNAVQTGAAGSVDEFLTSQLRIFIQQKGRLPQSFAEFAATRLDSVPHAPEGSKWVIDSATQEVKAVAN